MASVPNHHGLSARRKKHRSTMLDETSFCLTTHAIFYAHKRPRIQLLLIADFGQELRDFFIARIHDEDYYADAVTGHLYRMDGSSASAGSMRIEPPAPVIVPEQQEPQTEFQEAA
jgi:hypothetical protein